MTKRKNHNGPVHPFIATHGALSVLGSGLVTRAGVGRARNKESYMLENLAVVTCLSQKQTWEKELQSPA
jgi:hypothetical protein